MLKKHIPNTITCCNLISGCIATYFAFLSDFEMALLFIVIGAVFDFFDGMSARLLGVSSPIGKELDSLADDILRFCSIGYRVQLSVHIPHRPAVCSVPGIRDGSLLGPAPCQVQSRRASGFGIHRTAYSCQRPVLGLPCFGTAAERYHIRGYGVGYTPWHLRKLLPADSRDTYVCTQVQALGMER